MKAWERAYEIFTTAQPVVLSKEEQKWTENNEVSTFYDDSLSLDWASNVPGSGAPEKIMVAAVQALENRGYKVSEKGYEYLEMGLEAHAAKDFITLHKMSALLRRELGRAVRDEQSPYWKYQYYSNFQEVSAKVVYPEPVHVDCESSRFRDQIRAGWLSQMIGGAMGTMVEGYTSENLYRVFGAVYDYLREPNTFNDDITFELAFLDAFKEKGYEVTSEDVALAWAGLVPCGWSAEEWALRSIKAGIFPPESATNNNPFNEWIGAQMRAGICGMAAPGDPETAARLAWTDGEVSHANNGILGEVFNAMMTSLAFVEPDVKVIVKTCMDMIPSDSEYYSVISYAYDCCMKYEDWQDALKDCCEKYKKYNWIHAYPNACCEIIALMYGGNDYTETLHIITMCGVDVDCNAGMILPLIGIQGGMSIIPEKLMHPAFDELITYMRDYKRISLDELVDDTLIAIKKAKERERRRN